jgi:hypothetical protein
MSNTSGSDGTYSTVSGMANSEMRTDLNKSVDSNDKDNASNIVSRT